MSRQERWKLASVGLSALLLTVAPLSAGVVYEIEVKDHEQSPPRTESIEAVAEGGNFKTGIASMGEGKQGEMIFRGDRREMVIVDHDNMSYNVIDVAAIGQIAGQLSEAERMMNEALKNVPEDRRAMVEQMMKQNMPPEAAAPERPRSELKKTSERGDKNGYPCVKYEVWMGERKTRELWVTDWSNVEGGSDVVDVFEDMAEFSIELMDSLPDFGGQGGAEFGDTTFEHMKEIGGFPVVTREFDDNGSLEEETTLRSSRRQTIDPDAFEPPSGYKRQEMFGGPQ